MAQPLYQPSLSFPLSISRLSFTAFRNYADLRLDLDPAPVVLTGPNGSGKTNLLEAISLLVPGRGIRRAALSDLANIRSPVNWGVACELRSPTGPLLIGTGRDPQNENGEDRRVVHIDGQLARNQSALSEYVAMAWITPDMDRLLADASGPRRKWFDRLVYSFDPAHATRVNRYEKAMRERLKLLREGSTDSQWLTALENDMAQTGVAIAAARRQLLRQLRSAINETATVFPRADLTLKGLAEEALEEQPALPIEDLLRATFRRNRSEDAQSGTCNAGPHRSDILARHRAKDCPAELCSTGEQKALLITVMLAYVRVLSRHRQLTPLFLLDDIAAHLDHTRREALFAELRDLGVQAWLTGTDAETFVPFLPFTQHYMIDQGVVTLR